MSASEVKSKLGMASPEVKSPAQRPG